MTEDKKALDAKIAERILGAELSWSPLRERPEEQYFLDGSMSVRPLLKYSEDIKAAWLVVEYMNIQNHLLSLNHRKNGEWDAVFWYDSDKEAEGIGSTAPHAICLAALKAVGE